MLEPIWVTGERAQSGVCSTADGGQGVYLEAADALQIAAVVRRVLAARERGEVASARDAAVLATLATLSEALEAVPHAA